jgi:flagellar biosynthesis protein FlhB
MSAEQDADRNEAATPFKLEKAREKGQTARSADMVSAVAFLAGMFYAAAQGMALVGAVVQMAGAILGRAGVVPVTAIWPLIQDAIVQAALLLLPLFLVSMCAAVIAGMAQTGFVFSVAPLQADFNRMNPAAGLKRLFSLRTLFDGFRACLKLVALSTTAAFGLLALVPQFQSISALPTPAFLALLVDDVTTLGTRMAFALLAVAALDMLFTRSEFARNMRMSRRELKDEFKSREGDPRIRSRLRELRKELLKRTKSLRHTASADVVLTNPTHYAVALRYVHGEMPAPKVVAKGAGQLAAAMRGIAARHNVIVIQNPPLARRLFREAGLEQEIPPSFHAEVAGIFVWIMELRRQQSGTHGANA